MSAFFLGFLVLLCALVAQIVVSLGRGAAREYRPEKAAGWTRRLVGTSAVSAGVSFVIVLLYAVMLLEIGAPGECAPLSVGGVRFFGFMSVLSLAVVPTMATWAALRARAGRNVGWQVASQPVGFGLAIFFLIWLAGGTSC